MTIPLNPEPLETMKARFPEAIAERIDCSEDERVLEPKHFFDFDDGYRLNISRDYVEEGEFIIVTGGMVDGTMLPVTMIAARVLLHFAELTDMIYGQGEVVHFEPGAVVMAFKYAEGPSQIM
jgi:hypothetical protein